MTCRNSLASITIAVGAALSLGGIALEAAAQTAPLDIPFVKEWASSGHARSAEEPFTHWNAEGAVPPACARCHTTTGFQDYIGADGSPAGTVEKPHLTGQVVACVACHNSTTRALASVTFPSGLTIDKLGREAVCMTCHQGRESTVSVNKAIEGLDEDAVSDKLSFRNVHYKAAGATRYGTQAKGGYEYDGKTYAGLYVMAPNASVCTDCHTLHTFRVDAVNCASCHSEVKAESDFTNVRLRSVDFNGNGDVKEGIAVEVNDLHQRLIAAIQSYAKQVAGQPVVYDAHSYPYFFVDKNGNGEVDGGEAIAPNGYQSWTPRLLKAAYNYQFVAKDPGAYAHNPAYVLQLLYDSLESLSAKADDVDMASLTRP